MTTSFTSNDLQALLKFPFDDPRWPNKLLIGSLLMFAGFFVPIIPTIFVYGYCAQIMRRIIIDRGGPFLPEWEDWGRLFSDGAKLLGITFAYVLPLIVFFCAGYGLFMGLIFGMGAVAPTGAQDPDTVSPVFVLIPLLSVFLWMATLSLGMLAALALSIILPVVTCHVVATGEFAAGFRVSEWWPIFRANLGGFLLAYILVLALSMVLSFAMQIFFILCCLLPLIMPMMLYMMLITNVLYSQVYRVGVNNLRAINSPAAITG